MAKKMKNSKITLLFYLLVAASLLNCKKTDNITLTNGGEVENKVNEFIWTAMNQFYYWQADVTHLSDDKREPINTFNTYLNTYKSPESLFDDLLIDADRFSWIVDDYNQLEASFQGISKSFGYKFKILRTARESNNLLVYVEYVASGGPAENAGIERGHLFTHINNTPLTIDNYISLLQLNSYTVTLATYRGMGMVEQTNQNITITAVSFVENPILLSKVLDVEGTKIGYLMYNQFVSNNSYHEELNTVFGEFKNRDVSELVLDLRYNGGGSLLTSQILASMIYGAASSNDVLGKIVYNEKLAQLNSDIYFFDTVPMYNQNGIQTSTVPMNRLNINRLYVLISGSSASASEFVIAGLLPYMDITTIGTQTVGKNVGSITLYDSDDFQKSATLNPNHTYAMQPIISQLANSSDFTDYVGGFTPDIEINEINSLGNLRPLGDPNESLLSAAIINITGTARVNQYKDDFLFFDDNLTLKKPYYLQSILIDNELIPSSLRKIFNKN